MNITIYPQKLHGSITAIPSKSQAHRLLICSAFSDRPTDLICSATNQDIEATVSCLKSLGANITKTDCGYRVEPISVVRNDVVLECGESGSTLRFMLPIVGALGINATFRLCGRLPSRPLSPLWEEMVRMGCTLTRPTDTTIHCTGKLHPGNFTIAGNISSQYISGLFFATALMEGMSTITITGKVESQPYIELTQKALEIFGIDTYDYQISGKRPFSSPGKITVEGDWSNAAFFIAANALGSDIEIMGLDSTTSQGDRVVQCIVKQLTQNIIVDAGNIPDLVPILAVTAGAKSGATFTNVARLRLKESDRVASVAEMLNNLGAQTSISENELIIYPSNYHTCTINAYGDHRIAMSAAIAATIANGPVTILGAECVEKSYPSFWQAYKQLGGNYEQHIR